MPDSAKTEPVRDIEEYLGETLRRVDSSLLEEWERLRNPEFKAVEQDELQVPGAAEAAADITRDAKLFTNAIRVRIFSFLASLARGMYTDALESFCDDQSEAPILQDAQGVRWSDVRLRDELQKYTAEHGKFRLDAEGRAVRHTIIDKKEQEGFWLVQQMLQDYQDVNDAFIEFSVDLAASRLAGTAVVGLRGWGRV